MNLGTLFRVGTRTFSMVQDPNIHLLVKGAWGGAKRLQRLVRKSPKANTEPDASANAQPQTRPLGGSLHQSGQSQVLRRAKKQPGRSGWNATKRQNPQTAGRRSPR